jgi:methionine sulfoxide reductase catalytic subunit
MSESATASAVPAPGHDAQSEGGVEDSRAGRWPDGPRGDVRTGTPDGPSAPIGDVPVDGWPAIPESVHPSEAGARVTDSFRTQLTRGAQVVDPATWSGSVPVAQGIAPRVRTGRSRWFNLLWLLPIGFVVLLVAVAAAKGLRGIPAVQEFISRYPGTVQPTGRAPVTGTPLWVGVQHFLNLFLLLFIMRSGLQILSDHPRLYWTRHSTPGRPGHVGLPGLRHSIGLARWWHLGVNTLWLANGLLFYVLLFGTGHWQRLVPTSWAAFPHALSVLTQYLSLDWPTESGWVAYNSLQQFAYGITVFVAAPLAVLTGLGMSPALSTRFKRISTVLSIQTARSLHFLVMIWFLVFIVMHVALVATTGALRNLNHIYTGRDGTGWAGFWIFAVSMVIVTVGWVAATPLTLRHPRVVQRVGAALIGPVQRLFEHLDATPGQYTDKDVSPYFWHNGKYPDSDEYATLRAGDFTDYRLRVNGLVKHPVELSLAQLRTLPHHEQITQHFCIQGWSGIAKWGGVSMRTLMDVVEPLPEANWVVFYSLGEGADSGVYYDAHPIEQMGNHLTMLAYDMNGEPLPFGHGAPLRLRNEVQLGFKQVKWIKGVEFVVHYAEIGGGHGGYNQDHEFFGYRQAI